MAADQATTIENRQAGMKFTTDETIKNEQYAIPVDANQRFYESPAGYDTSFFDEQPSAYENPNEYCDPLYENTKTSSLSLMCRKETKSKYDQLS